MEFDGNEVNDEVIGVVAEQFNLDEDLVKEILNGTVCQSFAKMTDSEKAAAPEKIRQSCAPEKIAIEQQFLAQNLILDVQNAFQKEKMMHFSKAALKYKFKASEQYWDGRVSGPNDAPFDLITDLNLIDIVLFGSHSRWNADVYQFPTKEDNADQNNLPNDQKNPNNQPNNQNKPEEEPVECVTPDDPQANPNYNVQNPFCGNASVDLLLGEVCDDGNLTSGDGCDQFCQLENGGNNNQCIDPEAITFKTPVVNDLNLQKQFENPCPAGFVPKKKQTGQTSDTPQPESYAGPNIGGTLKQFPDSERPVCGPGTSAVEITVAGKKEMAKDSNGDVRCVPTEFCQDPDKVRDHLAATTFPFPIGPITAAEWRKLPEDHPIRKYLEAIEGQFCVNVIKNNRPLSPYNPNEGCVDCHITAMVDALEETLNTNVTPYENTTSAFGLSSRFGPNFSFNMITTLKPKLKLTDLGTAQKSTKKANEKLDNNEDEANPPKTTLPDPGPNFDRLQREVDEEKETFTSLQHSTGTYNWSSAAISDIELMSRVEPLIVQMRQSFENLQSTYQGIVESTDLDKTPECRIR